MEIPASFGLWLQKRRRALDLTQAALAECVGCSVVAIRKIEADERRPSRQVAELLADCLEIDPADRPTFLKVARAELRVDRLDNVKTADAPILKVIPPPTPLPARPPVALPAPPTPLLGREHELSQTTRLLQNPQCRLLTLIGPGGIGKTRLALEAATHQREAFTDGAYFVSLASVSADEFVTPAIADVIGFAFGGLADPQTQLLSYVRDKKMLLVLDNLEHLLEGAGGLLAALLQHAPEVKLLTTSRERLNLQGEWVFEVQGLPVPPSDQIVKVEEYSAVKLFLQRAQRVHVGFTLAVEERPAVARICRLVEGMPLGLELAATWVRVLSCREIAQEIEHNLDFLASSSRDASQRHQSLRAIFDHSWKLLSAEERRVLRRLAVFQGGFQRQAAEQVAGATLSLLSALVDKSLLRRTVNGRYDLHEVIRQFAAAYLADDVPEQTQTCERHCHYYLTWLAQQDLLIRSAQQTAAAAAIIAEFENIRLAWLWAATHQRWAELAKVMSVLYYFYELRRLFQEPISLFDQAISVIQAVDEASNMSQTERQLVLGYALATQGYFHMRCGQPGPAKEFLEQSLVLLQPFQGSRAWSDAIHFTGIFRYLAGDFKEGQRLIQESQQTKLPREDALWHRGSCLFHLGNAALMQGKYEEAYHHLSQARSTVKLFGDPLAMESVLGFLSGAAFGLGAYAEAQQLAQESLKMASGIGDRWSVAQALNQLGLVAQTEQDYGEAKYLFQESHAIYAELQEPWSTTRVLNNLGYTLYALKDYTKARAVFGESLAMAAAAQLLPVALEALVGLVNLRINEGTAEQALAWLTYALRHPAIGKQTKDRAEQLCLVLEAQLTQPQIAAAQAQTQTKTFDAVVQEVLSNHNS